MNSVPAKRTRPADVLADLRAAILGGSLSPGTPLRQDKLAASLGVSKIPVREALLRLVAEGLVSVETNRGFAVARLEPGEAKEILDIRAVLECRAIFLAVPVMSEATIAEAAEILTEAERTSSIDRWGELNWAFHALLYEPADRPRLANFIRQISNQTECYIRVLISNSNYRSVAEREHRTILAACTLRNGEAASALLGQHIRQTGDLIARFLDEQAARKAALPDQ
ncbi:MAG: GntR family transcriptional regulator [Hyphomicrobiaceae bacterium]